MKMHENVAIKGCHAPCKDWGRCRTTKFCLRVRADWLGVCKDVQRGCTDALRE